MEKKSKKKIVIIIVIAIIIVIGILILLFEQHKSVIYASSDYGSKIARNYTLVYSNDKLSFGNTTSSTKEVIKEVNDFAWEKAGKPNDVCNNVKNNKNTTCELNDKFIRIEYYGTFEEEEEDFAFTTINYKGEIIDSSHDMKTIIEGAKGFNFFYEDVGVLFEITTPYETYYIEQNTSCYEECRDYVLHLYNSKTDKFDEVEEYYGLTNHEYMDDFYIKDDTLYFTLNEDNYIYKDGEVIELNE